MNEVTKIYINKENASDNSYLLTKILAPNNSRVEAGAIIATIESSKAGIDIESPVAGYVHINPDFKVGMSLSVGAILAVISSSGSIDSAVFSNATPLEMKIEGRISKSALELIKANNLSEELFKALPLVRKKDVEDYIAKNSGNSVKNTATFDAASVVVLGGGGHAKMCIDVLKQMGTFKIAGIVDGHLPIGSDVLGIPVISRDDDTSLVKLMESGLRWIVNGVGSVTKPELRQTIFRRIKKLGLSVPTIIHPKAIVEPSVKLGEGCQIMMGANVGSSAVIGDNSIVNSGSVVSHDCTLSENTHIAPGAILAGGISIGENSVVGMGVTVYLGISIGDNVIIPNGEHVFKNIPSNYRGLSKVGVG